MHPRAPVTAHTVHVTSATIQCGDVLAMGGGHFTVHDLIALPDGARRAIFDTGETLTMRAKTQLTVSRQYQQHQRGRAG